MADSRHTLAANTLYSGVAVYAEYAATLLVSIVAARRLGPEDYGVYTLLMWIVLVGVTVANNGITTGVMKFVGESRGRATPAAGAAGISRYFERLQLLCAGAVCVSAAGLLALAPGVVSRYVQAPRLLLWIALAAILARSLYLFYAADARGFEYFRAGALVQASVTPVVVAATAVVAYAAGTLTAFVYAYAGSTVAYMVAMRLARARIAANDGGAPPPELVRRIHRHLAYASAIVALDLVVLRQTEIVFLHRFATPADIAYFGLGRSLAASAMLLVPGVLTALLVPIMSRTFGEDPAMLGRRFLAATRYIVILVVPVVVLCELFAGDIVTWLYGADYAPAVFVFRVMAAASAVGVVSASASSYQLGTDRQPAIVMMMAAVAVVTLILDYVLIRSFRLPGAVGAGAAGSLLLGTVLLWHARRALGVAFQWSVYARLLLAGAVAALPALALRAALPVWLALPLGGCLCIAAYALLSVTLRVWTRRDLLSMSAWTDGLPRRFAAPIVSFLEWGAGAGALRDEVR